MIRPAIVFLLLANIAIGQDSTFIQSTCKKIKELKEQDIEGQISVVYQQGQNYIPILMNREPMDKPLQKMLSFQYKFNRELNRTCPEFKLGFKVPILARGVVDFENKFTKGEIDSLKILIDSIGAEKSIYIFLVTTDDYFPDTTLTDFSNRNRESGGQKALQMEMS